MIIQLGDSDIDDDEYESDDDLIDVHDRQVIDQALQQAAEPIDSTNTTEICTDPRELTSTGRTLQGSEIEYLILIIIFKQYLIIIINNDQ